MASDAKSNIRKHLLRKYARLNLAVLPIGRPTADQPDSGKKPILKGGYKSAVIGKRKVERLFRAYPDANIGVATGHASGVVVLDVDPRHGGDKTFLALEETLGSLPSTWEVATSRGGRHLYFKLPPDMKLSRDTSGKIFGKGLDVLCEGSFAICPPSRHATGHIYSWKNESDLDSPPAELPRRWLRHLETALEARHPGASSPSATTSANNAIPAGQRNSTLFRFACGWRAGGDGPERLYERLKEVNRERCRPPLEKHILKEMAERVAEKYRAEPSTNLPSIIADSTLADRFGNGRHLLFHGGQFHQYGGTHWAPISEDHLKNAILAQIRGLAKQAHIKTASLMGEVVSILKADQVALTDPFGSTGDPLPIINCLNGEVWLGKDGSAELRPHRPDSGQLHTLKVDYDPDAECPEYRAATKRIFSNGKDPDRLVRYWDELFGYTIQPSRPHAIIVILLGEGGNGKTKLAETIMRLLGPEMVYSGRMEEIESNRFTIGALKDKRLFLDDDVRARIRLPDGVLKRLSEGKRITGEEKYKSPITFDLRAYPMLLCNNIPSLNDVSPGMKRRLQVIPFDKSFRGSDQDKMLFERIWANEMSGVLNRALEGWQRLKRRGDFKVPDDVRLATAKWIQDANPFSTFLDDTVLRDPAGRTPLGKVFARFLEWSKAAGVQRTLTRLQLRHDLQHEGYDIRKSNGEVVVRGLILKD